MITICEYDESRRRRPTHTHTHDKAINNARVEENTVKLRRSGAIRDGRTRLGCFYEDDQKASALFCDALCFAFSEKDKLYANVT